MVPPPTPPMPTPDAHGNFGGSWQVLLEAANNQRSQDGQGGSPASRTVSSASVAGIAVYHHTAIPPYQSQNERGGKGE